MEKKLSSLYRLGGLTGVLSGTLMFISGIWFIFNLSAIVSDMSNINFEELGRIGIFHGLGVVSLILLVPTLLAGYGLLASEAHTRAALGASLAIPWLLIELVAHCSQTAPLPLFSELAGASSNAAAMTELLYKFWAEWGEALLMTSAFLCVLVALCYGSALYSWGNPVAGALFLLSILGFPADVLLKTWLHLEIQLHLLLRGLAFFFLGGVLIQAPHVEDT